MLIKTEKSCPFLVRNLYSNQLYVSEGCAVGTKGIHRMMEQPLSPGHSSPPSCKKAHSSQEYIDLLDQRRKSSDLRWAVREWKSVGNYKYGTPMTREEVFDRVMQSDRVKHTINQVRKRA